MSRHNDLRPANWPGLEVIKLEYSLKLKKSAMIGCLRTHVRMQPIIAQYFEFENELSFINSRPAGRVWYLKRTRTTKAQASLRKCADSLEVLLLVYTNYGC